MSRRDRVRFTRPYSTGFTEHSRAESKLRTATLDNDLSSAQAAAEAQRQLENPKLVANETAKFVQSKPDAELPTQGPPPLHTPKKPVEQGAVDLVLPPGVGGTRFTLRMDVLDRQAADLRALAEKGVPIDNVLRAAATKVDIHTVKEEYVPQVAQRRARGIVHRIDLRVPLGFFKRLRRWCGVVRVRTGRLWWRDSLNPPGSRPLMR